MLCPQSLPSWRPTHAGRIVSPSLPTPVAAPRARSRAALRCRAGAAGEIVREVLSRSERSKQDTTDDRLFYSAPRFTQHVDDAFLAQLTELYRRLLPAGGAVLDVGASHISHLPEEVEYTVSGLGLNAEELSRNRRLTERTVRNLNDRPRGWPYADQSFDAIVCCVSIQYYERPEEVMAEIYRVLKPGGVLIISFSNRMFSSKAIAAWRDGTGYSRSQLVKQYISAVAGYTAPQVFTEVTTTPDLSPLGRLKALFARSSSDPFYAVVAYRNYKREDL